MIKSLYYAVNNYFNDLFGLAIKCTKFTTKEPNGGIFVMKNYFLIILVAALVLAFGCAAPEIKSLFGSWPLFLRLSR